MWIEIEIENNGNFSGNVNLHSDDTDINSHLSRNPKMLRVKYIHWFRCGTSSLFQ